MSLEEDFSNKPTKQEQNLPLPKEIKDAAPEDNVVTLPQRQELAENTSTFEAMLKKAAAHQIPAAESEPELKPAAVVAAGGTPPQEPPHPANDNAEVLTKKEPAITSTAIEEVAEGSSIIPPQTEPAIPYLHPTYKPESQAPETNFSYAREVTGDAAKAMIERTSEWLPHSPIGRLAARAERAGIRLINLPQEKIYGALYQWRTKHAAVAEINYKTSGKKVTEMQAQLAKADQERDAAIEKQRAAGLPTADIAKKLEEERSAVLKKIGQAQKIQDRSGKRLEDMNARKAAWAKKENDLAESIMAGIDQKLAEPRAVLDTLVAKRPDVQTNLERLKRARDMGHEGLQELEAKLKSNPGKSELVVIEEKKRMVVELLEKIDANYAEATSTLNSIDKKMRRANNYISGWMNYRNEEARVSTQDRRTFSPGTQNIEEEAAHQAPTLTHVPDAPKPEAAPALMLEPESFAALWNALYGKELKIKADVFTQGLKANPGQEFTIDELEAYFSKTMAPNGKIGGKEKYSKEELAVRFAKIRSLLAESA